MPSQPDENSSVRQQLTITDGIARQTLVALFERLAERYAEDWGEIPEEFALRLEIYVDPQDTRSSALVDTLLRRETFWPG